MVYNVSVYEQCGENDRVPFGWPRADFYKFRFLFFLTKTEFVKIRRFSKYTQTFRSRTNAPALFVYVLSLIFTKTVNFKY